MAKYYTLQLVHGYNNYTYINETKFWSGSTLLSHNDFTVVANTPVHEGDPSNTVDGINQNDTDMCYFYQEKLPGWIMYEYTGSSIIDGISITARNNSGLYGPTTFKLYEIDSNTVPEAYNPLWQEVVHVSTVENTDTAYDSGALTTSTDFSENTIHTFNSNTAPEKRYYKLDIIEGYLEYAYINELKLWNGQSQISHEDLNFITSSPTYRGDGSTTVDGTVQQEGDVCWFYDHSQTIPAYLIYEYTGSENIDGLSISARTADDLYGPTTFKFYELDSSTTPLQSDFRWKQVLSVASATNSTAAYDPGSKAHSSNYADNTVHPFGPHVNLSAKTLLRNASGVTFTYSSGSFTQVNAGQPSETDFMNHGMSTMPYIPKNELMAWEPSGSFTVEYYDQLATTSTNKQLRLTSVPKAQIALPVNVIDITGVSELNGISVTQELQFTGDTRFAISIDGTNWKAWNGTSWDDLNALSADLVSADYLMGNGMNINVLNDLTWTELQQLYTSAPTNIAIAYAAESKLLNDVAAIDRMELSINHEGEKWVRDHGQIELEISETGFVATPAIDCTFKVNYQDTAA